MNPLQFFITQADTSIELNEMEWKIVFELHGNDNQSILPFFSENSHLLLTFWKKEKKGLKNTINGRRNK